MGLKEVAFLVEITVERKNNGLTMIFNGEELRGTEMQDIPIKHFVLEPTKKYSSLNIDHSKFNKLEQHLLYTIQDLENKIFDSTEYSLNKASGLIRLLIAEDKPGSVRPGNSLGLQVADSLGVTLSFDIAHPLHKLGNSGKEPNYAPNSKRFTVKTISNDYHPPFQKFSLNIDEFLNSVVIYQETGNSTIYDIIKTLAEVLGGIHLGEPKSMKLEKNRIIDFDKQYMNTDMYSLPISYIRQIGEVVLSAFEPVVDALVNRK